MLKYWYDGNKPFSGVLYCQIDNIFYYKLLDGYDDRWNKTARLSEFIMELPVVNEKWLKLRGFSF